MGHPNGYRPYREKSSSIAINKEEEIIYLSLEEATKVWLSLQVKDRKITDREADKLWAKTKNLWVGDGRAAIKIVVDYFSPAQDLGLVFVIAKDLGRHVGQTRIQNYRGVPYIIFKGNQRSRQILTASRYGLSNAKIISLGIGKEGVKNVARKGGIVSIVLVTVFNIADFVLNDQATLSSFTASMTVDVGIVVASTAAGLMAGAAVAGTALAAVAAGPLIVAVLVTVGVSIALGYLAERFQIKEKLTQALDGAYQQQVAQLKALKRAAESKAVDVTTSVLEYMLQTASKELLSSLKRSLRRRFGQSMWLQF